MRRASIQPTKKYGALAAVISHGPRWLVFPWTGLGRSLLGECSEALRSSKLKKELGLP